MTTRAMAIVVGTSVVLGAAVGAVAIRIFTGNDDRPPIIVRSGSVTADDGDPNQSAKWKPWKKVNNSKRQYQPDQSNGAPVLGYAVSIGNADSGTPSNPCPQLPMFATTVVIDYSYFSTPPPGHTNPESIVISKVGSAGKEEPQVDFPGDTKEPTAGNGSTPPRITYDPGQGWISKVTVSVPTGSLGGSIEQSCAFNRTDPGKAFITVQPVR